MLIHDREIRDNHLALISEKHFADDKNAKILNLLKDVQEANEFITLDLLVKKCSFNKKLCAILYIIYACGEIPFFAFKGYLETLNDFKIKREINSMTFEISKLLNQNKINEAIETGKQMGELKEVDKPKYCFSATEALLNKIKNLENQNEEDYLMTGFKDLDKLTKGFKKKNLITIGARPSVGKTVLALNIAEYIAKDFNVIFFSLEQSCDELISRIIMRHAKGVNLFTSEKLTANDFNQLINLNIEDMCKNLVISELINLKDIMAFAKQENKNNKLSCVFIDHLTLVQIDNKFKSEVDRLAEITRQLKQMARELDICVIVLSQLNRDSVKRTSSPIKPEPTMTDLRNCGAIEQDSDIVILMHRDGYGDSSNNTEEGMCKLIVDKARNNKTGHVYLQSNLKHFEFKDKY
jgi:replicative DNA helicase